MVKKSKATPRIGTPKLEFGIPMRGASGLPDAEPEPIRASSPKRPAPKSKDPIEEPPKPPKPPSGLTRQQLEDNPVLAAEHLGRIKDRDDDSEIVPFKARWIQLQFFGLVAQVQAFNLFKSTKRLGDPMAERSLASICGLTELSAKAQEAVPLIAKALPNRVLREMKKLGYSKVTDSPVRIAAVKPRRVGLSTAIEWLMTHRMVCRDNNRALVFGHEGSSAEEALGITSGFIQDWPDDGLIPPPVLVNDAATIMKFENRSRYNTKVASGKMDARGFQVDIIHMTEFAHYPNTRVIASARSGIPKHCWQFIESTANGPQGEFYRIINKAKPMTRVLLEYDEQVSASEKDFFLFFVPWIAEPGYQEHVEAWEEQRILETRDEYEIMLQAKYPEVTTGRLKWRRSMIENECQGHDELTPEAFFAQEYPVTIEEAFQKGANSVFDPKFIADCRLKAQLDKPPKLFTIVDRAPPVQRHHDFQANTWIWEPPIPGASYAMGIDVAKGLRNKDKSWITICKRIDDIRIEQVAEWCGWITQPGLAHVAVFLAEWYNNAHIIPETNDAIAFLTALTEPEQLNYPNVYIRKVLDAQTMNSGAWRFGFLTANRQAKKFLIERLQYDTKEGHTLVRSSESLHQIEIYQRDEDGGYGAPEGEHDDAVMALALVNFGHTVHNGAPPLDFAAREAEKKNEAKLLPGHASLPPYELALIQRLDAATKLIDSQFDESLREAERANNPFA